MKMKIFGIVVLSAMVLAALSGSASATTLEEGGVTKNSSVTMTLSLQSGTSLTTRDTSGNSVGTCNASHIHWSTSSPFTNSSDTGPVTTMTFESCSTPSVTVHMPGSLEVTWISGTNGTVASEETDLTKGSPIGTVTCSSGATTNLGTLTGVASGTAMLDVNAVINCTILGTTKWEATYTVTSPSGLGVSS